MKNATEVRRFRSDTTRTHTCAACVVPVRLWWSLSCKSDPPKLVFPLRDCLVNVDILFYSRHAYFTQEQYGLLSLRLIYCEKLETINWVKRPKQTNQKNNFKAATRSTLPHVAFLWLFIVGTNSEVDDFQSDVRSCASTSTAVSAIIFSPPLKVAVFRRAAVILIDFMLLYR